MDAMNGNNPSSRSFTSQIYHDTYDFIKLIRGNFSDRRVLITGASKGIGSETVVSFARAGYAHIALLARSSTTTTMEKAKDAAQAAGHPSPRFLELRADLVSMNSIASAAAKVQEAWGRLDILINNAGYLEAWKPIAESDPEDWWRSWEVNLKGSYLIDRAFIPLLLNGTEKTLVTVTSAGAWANHSGASAYQGSKMAQIKLNGHLMSEYGDQGLIVYSIHPGGVETELASGMPKYMSVYLKDKVNLAGDTLVWLTQERRAWLSDRYLSVGWDMEELVARKDEIVNKDLLKIDLRM